MRVRDDPQDPDPQFADLYGRLAPPERLEPWLGWAAAARPPVLYLGIGAGRLAAPLARAGVEIVGVDAHPGMLRHLRRRLPAVEAHEALVEHLDLGQRFDLAIAPSNLLHTAARLAGAARQLAPAGRLGFELLNPHWLAAGAGPGVRVVRLDRHASLEIEYRLPGGEVWVQEASGVELVWPERIEAFLARAGLRLLRLGGEPGLELDESPTYFVLAERA